MIFNSPPRITQYFAANPEYYAQFDLFGHEGIDLVPEGGDWTIFAWTHGVVTRRYTSTVYGETVIIYEPTKGLSWRVAHMDRVYADEGAMVGIGQQLGVMGDTPRGRGGIGGIMRAHLHINCIPMNKWETRDFPDNGFKGRVDPLGVLRERGEL